MDMRKGLNKKGVSQVIIVIILIAITISIVSVSWMFIKNIVLGKGEQVEDRSDDLMNKRVITCDEVGETCELDEECIKDNVKIDFEEVIGERCCTNGVCATID